MTPLLLHLLMGTFNIGSYLLPSAIIHIASHLAGISIFTTILLFDVSISYNAAAWLSIWEHRLLDAILLLACLLPCTNHEKILYRLPHGGIAGPYNLIFISKYFYFLFLRYMWHMKYILLKKQLPSLRIKKDSFSKFLVLSQ